MLQVEEGVIERAGKKWCPLRETFCIENCAWYVAYAEYNPSTKEVESRRACAIQLIGLTYWQGTLAISVPERVDVRVSERGGIE